MPRSPLWPLLLALAIPFPVFLFSLGFLAGYHWALPDHPESAASRLASAPPSRDRAAYRLTAQQLWASYQTDSDAFLRDHLGQPLELTGKVSWSDPAGKFLRLEIPQPAAPARVMSLKQTWNHIAAAAASTVDIRCDLQGPPGAPIKADALITLTGIFRGMQPGMFVLEDCRLLRGY